MSDQLREPTQEPVTAHGRGHATMTFGGRVLAVHREGRTNRFLSQLGETSVPLGQSGNIIALTFSEVGIVPEDGACRNPFAQHAGSINARIQINDPELAEHRRRHRHRTLLRAVRGLNMLERRKSSEQIGCTKVTIRRENGRLARGGMKC